MRINKKIKDKPSIQLVVIDNSSLRDIKNIVKSSVYFFLAVSLMIKTLEYLFFCLWEKNFIFLILVVTFLSLSICLGYISDEIGNRYQHLRER